MEDKNLTSKLPWYYLKQRLTVGFITSGYGFEMTPAHWLGMMDEARKQDVNVVCFPGAILRSSGQSQQIVNPLRGILYDLVDRERIQGLIIWTSMINWYSSPQQMAEFFEQYRPRPMVSAEVAMEGYPSVLVDDYGGMKQAVNHLIEEHGLKRLAFIRGPEGHLGAQERYRGYVDALTDHNIPLDPKLVTPPNPNWSGEEIKTLLDKRGLRPGVDIQGIVGANTQNAKQAMDILKARGLHVPHDLAVVSFDLTSDVYTSNPPLTAVNQQVYDVSRQCMRLVLSQLSGDEVPAQTVVPAQLIIGQSCGCISQKVTRAARSGKGVTQAREGNLFDQKKTILSGLPQSGTVFAEDVAALLDAFINEISATMPARSDPANGYKSGFLRTLEKQLLSPIVDSAKETQYSDLTASQRMDACQEVVSALSQATLSYLKGGQLAQANDLWQQAQAIVGEMSLRVKDIEQVQLKNQAQLLRGLSQTLITTFDTSRAMDVLATGLPDLGILGAYLALYEDPNNPMDQARLVLAYNEGGSLHLEAEQRSYPTRTLLPAEVLPDSRPYSLVVEPLYFGEQQLGLAMFEVGGRDGELFEALRGEISSALQGAILVQRVQERSAEVARQKYILDTFLENVPDEIYFKDLDSRITRANKAHALKLGLDDPNDEIGKNDFDFFPEDQARLKFELEQEIMLTGQPILNLEESDGKNRWALTTKMPLRDENGRITGTFGISRDITERKQFEYMLAKRASEMATVAQVSTEAALSRNPDELLQRVVDLSKTSFNLYHAHIYLLNETGDTLVLTFGAGEVGRKMVAKQHTISMNVEKSLVARAAREQQAVSVEDVHSNPNFLPNPLLPETRSELAVPMIVGDKVLGVFDVQSDQRAGFSKEDSIIYSTLASQVAVALQNVRSYREVQQRAEREALIASINQKIQSTTTVEGALKMAVREVGRALGTQASVRLAQSEKNK